MKRKYWLLLLVVAILLNGSPALADGDFYVVAVGGGVGTKITKLPYPIDASGFYYVTNDLSVPSGSGIIVNANDVTIDLMGFSLTGNGSVGPAGIYISSGLNNIEVRNGTLKNWFRGIYTDGGSSHRIINIRAEGNTNGINLNGFSHLIKGCTTSNNGMNGILLNGGGTISGNVANYNINAGISVTGYATISGNIVSNGAHCIDLQGPGSIIGNTVIPEIGQTGINLRGTANNFVMLDQNTVSGDGTRFAGGSASYVRGTNAGF